MFGKIEMRLYENNQDILIITFLVDKLVMQNTVEVADEGRSMLPDFNFKHIIVNTEKLNKIDSMGLGFILEMRNAAIRDRSGEFTIVITSDHIFSAYNEIGVDDFIKQFPSLEEAISYIESR
ncbi:MAG: STAS domain-containing protein [bacterium]|nr:STAS domain-containing protein [bacterium]